MEPRKYPAKSPKKRNFRNFNNLALIDKPTSYGEKTTVHAMITSLSPTKGKFFDGSISDETGTMRLVGFNDAKRKKLENYL